MSKWGTQKRERSSHFYCSSRVNHPSVGWMRCSLIFYDSSVGSSLLCPALHVHRGVVICPEWNSLHSYWVDSVLHARLHIFITISAAQQQHWLDMSRAVLFFRWKNCWTIERVKWNYIWLTGWQRGKMYDMRARHMAWLTTFLLDTSIIMLVFIFAKNCLFFMKYKWTSEMAKLYGGL